MGSIAFSRLDSPSIRWLECTTPFIGESVVNPMRVLTEVVTVSGTGRHNQAKPGIKRG